MDKKRVMFAFTRTGGGHISPAKAVSEYINAKYADTCEVIMSDFFHDIGATKLDEGLRKSWDVMLKHPLFNKYGHTFISLFPSAVRLWVTRKFSPYVKAAAEYVEGKKPDIIVSTHGFAAFTLERVKELGGHEFRLISLSTDPLSSHIFFELLQQQDGYIVGSEYPRDRLLRTGIPADKISVLPFPINPKFNPKLAPDPALASELGLDPARKTLLVSFGGQGVGSIETYIDALITAERALNVIVVCGRNEALQQKLGRRYNPQESGPVNNIPLGFVDNMPALIALSDFCFIKPGVSTTYENMIMHKPIIFYESAAHIENANIAFAEAHGIGRYAGKRIGKFLQAIAYYLDGDGLARTKEHYRTLDLVNGTAAIGDYLVSMMLGQQ